MRHIRKYMNRKHYDMQTSAYLQVVDIAKMVALGETISVVCDVTGRDITLETLCRALYERVKERDLSAKTSIATTDVAKLIRQVAGRKGE